MVHRGWRLASNPRRPSSEGDKSSQYLHKAISSALNQSSSRIPLQVSSVKSKPNTVQEFAFVNVTEPGRPKDAETKKLVRGHVVKDSTRKKRLIRQLNAARNASVGSVTDAPVTSSKNRPVASDSDPSAIIIPGPTQGLDPHPHLSPIIHHLISVGDAMYPFVSAFRFNPISPAKWFYCALKDDALFHALLYTTSTYLGLLKGVTENNEAIVHAGRSIALVRERLDRMGRVGGFEVEGTVRAVSCLAMSECLRGNYEGWKLHMGGMKQMVDLKGGLTGFSPGLQLKLHRADLKGASEYLVPAFFAEANSLPKIPAQDIRKGGEQLGSVLALLNVLPISADLCNTLIYMHGLSQSVSGILMSPTALTGSQQVSLMQHIYSLRYNLLPDHSHSVEFADDAARTLDEVLRIGALLYISETPKEFPNAAVGPLKMVKRLRELVISVQMWNEKEAGLVFWLLFFGGIAARQSEDRVWFSVQIERLSKRLGISDWEDVRGRLEVLWWIKGIHEKTCRKLWDEVLILKEMKVGITHP
ncbi:hypothetical protein ONS95_006743 [Cadophora gregata]|uniref:uncharacterized protein n=1 Tax=Cadophora gregata TaxID=51156 RepID=UPI0026DB70FD|nr:uncharacterized protein ONS95_006743 [Cadophora gregata]KAK0101579.1 hypothetical protein ONS95_006743 [Cadophora gregata]